MRKLRHHVPDQLVDGLCECVSTMVLDAAAVRHHPGPGRVHLLPGRVHDGQGGAAGHPGHSVQGQNPIYDLVIVPLIC